MKGSIEVGGELDIVAIETFCQSYVSFGPPEVGRKAVLGEDVNEGHMSGTDLHVLVFYAIYTMYPPAGHCSAHRRGKFFLGPATEPMETILPRARAILSSVRAMNFVHKISD
jgi:hypothetical protein